MGRGALRGETGVTGVGELVTLGPGSEALHYPEDASVAAYPRTQHRQQIGSLAKGKVGTIKSLKECLRPG